MANFTLKNDISITIDGTTQTYNNATITDAVALHYIARNRNRKSLFLAMPLNVDALVDALNIAEDIEPIDTSEENDHFVFVAGINVPGKTNNRISTTKALQFLTTLGITIAKEDQSVAVIESKFRELSPANKTALNKLVIAHLVAYNGFGPMNVGYIPFISIRANEQIDELTDVVQFGYNIGWSQNADPFVPFEVTEVSAGAKFQMTLDGVNWNDITPVYQDRYQVPKLITADTNSNYAFRFYFISPLSYLGTRILVNSHNYANA
jgi:hypothetical protein